MQHRVACEGTGRRTGLSLMFFEPVSSCSFFAIRNCCSCSNRTADRSVATCAPAGACRDTLMLEAGIPSHPPSNHPVRITYSPGAHKG